MASRSSEKTSRSEKLTQLGLVPLHPGSTNKTKLEAKAFPLVLGRTNLASWWWKSCPCEKYCRLHCKPVAQNIRSLSKVMIMIDSFGCLNTVGKNPHLITVTPERSDCILHENDVISIGRRDREPWMRLQVVKKPNDSKLLSKRTSDPAKEWMVGERDNDAGAATRIQDNRIPSSLPKWITTTRKRNAASRFSGTRQQRISIGATPDGLVADNQRHQNGPINLHGDLHKRKRRRTRDTLRDRRRSHDESSGFVLEKNEKHPTGAARASDHIHLLVQDYARSAMLVEATQRRRTQNSSSGSFSGNMSPQRSLATDESQLNLMSPSFAAALVGAVAPASSIATLLSRNVRCSSQHDGNAIQQPPKCLAPESDRNLTGCPKQEESLAVECVEGRKGDILLSRGLDNTSTPVAEATVQHIGHPNMEKSDTARLSSTVGNVESIAGTLPNKLDDSVPESDQNFTQRDLSDNSVSRQASMVSLPMCASFTAESIARELQMPSNDNAATSRPCHERNASPSSQGLLTPLGRWRAVIENERGNQSSFRHALASLIVVKNESKAADDGSSLWLPDLLDDAFFS